MRPREALSLFDLRLPSPDPRTRALAGAHSVDDLRRAARRRLPRSVFDYVDGGADEERSLTANVEAIRQWCFAPAVLTDVSRATTATTVLGREARAPIGLAPTGYTRMLSPLGEPAVARAAARRGVPYVLSTMATTSLEDLAADPAAASADRWFQLYVWKDRGVTREMIARADAAGYRVLEVAVDTTVSGMRVRDVRNGFTIPPKLTLRSVLDIATKPRYWLGMLRSPALEFANVRAAAASGGFTIANITSQFDASLGWDDLERVREQWPGKLVLKGPVGPEDAARAKGLGVDAVHLSNHGGRQLDRLVAPIDLVGPVRQAVGDGMGVLVDSGFRHGADVAVAIALGADAAFVGRAYLWGLVAAGSPGVERVVDLLASGLLRTMQLLGVRTVEELRARGPELLRRAS
ncbi:alpha-hydroxy acid oxidase [Patulibacter sp. S7RM1-6]